MAGHKVTPKPDRAQQVARKLVRVSRNGKEWHVRIADYFLDHHCDEKGCALKQARLLVIPDLAAALRKAGIR